LEDAVDLSSDRLLMMMMMIYLLRRIQRDVVINVHSSSCEVPVIVVIFYET
jgi:hypothetical protein